MCRADRGQASRRSRRGPAHGHHVDSLAPLAPNQFRARREKRPCTSVPLCALWFNAFAEATAVKPQSHRGNRELRFRGGRFARAERLGGKWARSSRRTCSRAVPARATGMPRGKAGLGVFQTRRLYRRPRDARMPRSNDRPATELLTLSEAETIIVRSRRSAYARRRSRARCSLEKRRKSRSLSSCPIENAA